MASEVVTALGQALSQCAAADLSVLSAAEVGVMVVDLRRVATRLEAEIARAVHAVSQVEAWRVAGATSVEAWLAAETQVSMRSARDQVRLAGTLAAAPVVAEKMADGEQSIDNARLLGAVVGHDRFVDDADLLVEIASGSPRETRRGLERWLAMSDPGGEAEREEQLRLKRHLTFTANGDGMYDVKGALMPVDVAQVRAALDHIDGAAYADETSRPHKMCLSCSTHHDYVHHKGWKYIGDNDDLSIRKPDGTLTAAPPRGPAFPPPQHLQLVYS